jgi:hypothetical protein
MRHPSQLEDGKINKRTAARALVRSNSSAPEREIHDCAFQISWKRNEQGHVS